MSQDPAPEGTATVVPKRQEPPLTRGQNLMVLMFVTIPALGVLGFLVYAAFTFSKVWWIPAVVVVAAFGHVIYSLSSPDRLRQGGYPFSNLPGRVDQHKPPD